ncbi:hypothetical protein AMJ87_12115 [candidate division WOR_3 bacterium SM23_60]|uniref:Peptidase M1 membrane alanine aminopeptidase domain-containing protein n=1 Tax=candidate division WOR_3 bacterium SM23_60 TaxID=1703780 RepID=A0A0S8G5X5_UNCW3|nr:MAG: hypothetical protein AMJ87_12115 [candidate division WOR_3 bacterium SM23_60]
MMPVFILCLLQWQQQVHYTIEAYLDTEKHVLSAVEYCRYYNQSPCVLETLYLHIYANAFKAETAVFAQEAQVAGIREFTTLADSLRGGVTITSVTERDSSLTFHVRETILEVVLPSKLEPGDSVMFSIIYELLIPWKFSRLGYVGEHYEMAHWYPTFCVFDKSGWHRDPYHMIGEFYGEYGTYDITIDVPGDYVVAATGERIEVSDIAFIDALIRTGQKKLTGARRRVRFLARNVHDFAWVCDPDFLIEQERVGDVNIQIFYRAENKDAWRNARSYAVDAVTRYSQWYMPYPYKNMSIVNGYGYDGVEYPQLVILAIGETGLIRYTRLFELVIAHEVAHQWFYGILGSNEIDEAWLDEGFASYAELCYLEDKYGTDHSLITVPLVSPVSRTYLHELVYYVAQTNRIEQPILTPAYAFLDIPFSYTNSAYSKPVLFLRYLESFLGSAQFERIIQRYFQEYAFTHPTTQDFLTICEEETNRDLDSLFYRVLRTTDFSDWQVTAVTDNSVEVVNAGSLRLPTDVLIETEFGARVVPLSTERNVDTIILPASAGKVKRVTIDPYGNLIEANRWNNHYPRKFRMKPIFAFPSFDYYTILYAPFIWYSSFDGIQVGMYFFGDQFADVDFMKGRHQWFFGADYGSRCNKMYFALRYQTPVLFDYGVRTRVRIAGSNANDEMHFRAGIRNSFGIPFSRSPQWTVETYLAHSRMMSLEQVDTIDWQGGAVGTFGNTLGYDHAGWHAQLDVAVAHEVLASDWDFTRVTLTVEKEAYLGIPFRMRMFAGRIFGDAPIQEQLYLSGALRINFLADLFFSQAGSFSPQEHIHIKGHGNMRGYQTLHIKSKELFCINTEVPSRFPIRLFFDVGYYRTYAADFGARVVLGPVSLNVPFYTRTDEPWKLRWSIGF